jgi:polyisoprenyl-teichoic acid--peptidoglycan teichoic acid transferase
MSRRWMLMALMGVLALPFGLAHGQTDAAPDDVRTAPAADLAAVQAADEEWLTVLLLGGDAGPERGGLRTDTIIVVSVNRDSARAVAFAVPRDTYNVPLPAGPADQFACRCWPDRINALYAYGLANPALFPGDNPGAVALKGAIGELLGIPIDHYALVDMAGFVEVIDVLGGVTIQVPEQVLVRISPAAEGEEWQVYDIQPGQQELDGHEALAYARSRVDGTDYDRMLRQRCLLGAVVKEADLFSLLRNYPDFVEVAKERVQTDIPLDMLPDLIELADRVDTDEVIAVGLTPPEFVAAWTNEQPYPNPILNVDLVRAAVQAARNGTLEAVGVALPTLPGACGWTG